MAEQQQQQQQEQQEQVNNQNRLPSDWFYSSVMLTNRLDIGEHANIVGFQMDHLERNDDQSSLSYSNHPDSEFLRQNTDILTDIYSNTVTTTPSSSFTSSSFRKTSFLTAYPETPLTHDKTIQNLDMEVKSLPNPSNRADLDCAYTTASSGNNFAVSSHSNLHNAAYQTRHSQRDQINKSRKRADIGSSRRGKKNDDNIQPERRIEEVEVEVEDSDGDDEGAPPSALYSHSTTNSSDKMKWDCGVRWPSAKRRIGMLTSSYSVNIDAHDNSGIPDAPDDDNDDGDGNGDGDDGGDGGEDDGDNDNDDADADLTTDMGSCTEMMDIDSELNGKTGEIIQVREVTTNTTLDNENFEGNNIISKGVMQLEDESNLTDASTTMATLGVASSLSTRQCSRVGESDERQRFASQENSIKVPIKKRLIHSSLTSALYNTSAGTTNTCTIIPPNTYDTSSEHHQLLPTTIASGTTIASIATDSAFSSCYQMSVTGSTGTVINDDPIPSVTTYPKLLTTNDVYGNILNDHIVRTVPNSAPPPITLGNSLSEAEIVNLLCQNLCDIERIIAQQRNAYSGTPGFQLPSLLSQCNGEQKPQVSYTGPLIVPNNEQQQQHQHHYHHHNVTVERRRSATIDSCDTRRFHPYATTTATTTITTTTITAAAAATTTTTTITTTTSTKAVPTTACCSNSITVWSPSLPSRADLKQKYLRSLAPVLYDLLTDDCESKNCQKTTDSMDCTILKSCVEPSVDSYFRSLSLLAATASLPITNNKFDHLPFNYIDYFALQQCSLLLGSAPVTSTDLLKLAQSANLLYSATVTTPTSNAETVLSDKIPFTNRIDQVNCFSDFVSFDVQGR
uniref:Uncharacterized protein n=1 Tax=Setaria digitata TaxID=48799 RepID=A0A915PKF5_9BILA